MHTLSAPVPLYAQSPELIRSQMGLDTKMEELGVSFSDIDQLCMQEQQIGRLTVVGGLEDTMAEVKDVSSIYYTDMANDTSNFNRADFKRVSGRALRALAAKALEVTADIDPRDLHIVYSMRAGMAFSRFVDDYMPGVTSGTVTQKRDEETQIITNDFSKIGAIKGKRVLIVDPMLATANSIMSIIGESESEGANGIITVNLYTAPQGLYRVLKSGLVVSAITAQLEAGLNGDSYIVGPDGRLLGDFGDLWFGPNRPDKDQESSLILPA